MPVFPPSCVAGPLYGWGTVSRLSHSVPQHFPAPEEVWQRVAPGSKFFIAADLAAGYWQYSLDEESSLLSTCLTKFGKVRFTRLPMGISSSGDYFNQVTDRVIEGMATIVKVVYNVLMFSDTLEGVAQNLKELLTRFEANNVTLAPKKFQFGDQVLFAGMRVTKDSCAPDSARLEATEQYPQPKTRSQVRQLLGLVQQFSRWVPDMAPATVNTSALLRKNTAFVWSPECQEEFMLMKLVLTDQRYNKPFDPILDTELLVDTSRVSGCGYILIQRTPEGAVHIVRCGSMAAQRGWAGMGGL